MNVWAIADLHLSFGVPEKTMEIFGPQWEQYAQKIETRWRESVAPEDLVLVAGDISWALALQHAQIDLDWIDRLPGTKVLIKGNHDYWWSSLSKVKKILPSSLHLIQNNVFDYHGISVGGSRLWDTDEFNFNGYIPIQGLPSGKTVKEEVDPKKIFNRELERLETSLSQLKETAEIRIAMTHYPPLGADLKPSKASALLEKYHVDFCVFGHLHNVKQGTLTFGKSRGVTYYLTSSDFLDFRPLKIYSSAK